MKANSFNIKKKYLIIFFSIVSLHTFCQVTDKLIGIRNYGQDFEFVQIDCANDSLIVLNDSLPNFYYTPYFSSAYDAVNQKYYLTYGQNMEIIDATNGNVDTIFVFTNINPNYFIHIVFNPIDGLIYGIKYNQATFDEVFSKFDPSNGSLTDLFTISPVVGVGIGCKASFDPYLGEYYIQSRSLASINIHSGQVIYDLPFQNPTNEWLDHLAYSCSHQKFYGLTNNYHTSENYFSEIDSSSGITSRVNAAPLPTYFFKQYLSGSTIDNTSGIYYYAAARSKLYGIDIHSGSVVYSHDFGPDYQFLFLESASPTICLSDGIESLNNSARINIFPNPATDQATIKYSISKKALLIIVNSLGEIVQQISLSAESQSATIDLSKFKSGAYTCKMVQEGKVDVGRLIVIH